MGTATSFTKSEIEEIKTDPGVLRIYGGRLRGMHKDGKGYRAYCPFHDDRNPSFEVNLVKGTWVWICRPCGNKGGSIIDLVMEKDGLTLQAAVHWIAQELGIRPEEQEEPEPSKSQPAPLPEEPEEEPEKKFTVTEEQVQEYVRNLPDPSDIFHKAWSYFYNSGFDTIAESLKLGYRERKYFNCNVKGCENCKEYPALTIPLYCDGKLTALKYRNLETPDKAHKWTQEEGGSADFLWLADLPPADPRSKVIGVFEGISDTALARALGFNSVGILSASFKDTDRFRASVNRIMSTYEHVVLIGDNDQSGSSAMIKLYGFFDGKVSYIPLQDYKDLSEFYKATGEKTVSEWLRTTYKGALESTIPPSGKSTDPILGIPAVYPIEVWDGTTYGTFAEVCGKNNYIPREFFIESLKTIVGAAAGHRIGVEGTEQEGRFYTALIGQAGRGKSTAIKWAMSIMPGSLLYSAGDPTWEDLGCYRASYGSQPPLVKDAATYHQILQHNDELTALADKFGISGSGGSLLSTINQLYEKGEAPSNKTKHAAYDIEHPLHFSLLGATTPDKWEDTFGGRGVEGSGFFQRLNLIGSEETRTVVPLTLPNLQQFGGLVEKIKALREKRYDLVLNNESKNLLQKWHHWLEVETGKDIDADAIVGRLNVLALRNAAHLGWLLPEAEPEEVIRRAIMLSNYQLAMRRKYRPLQGDSVWAKVENKIRRYAQKVVRIKKRELAKKVHSERCGTKVFNQVLDLLKQENEIRIEASSGKRPVEWVVWIGN